MSDFPEKIWVTHKEEFPGHVSFRASNLDHSNSPDGTYPEYIRADLVPQWQPIDTAPTNVQNLVRRSDHVEERSGDICTAIVYNVERDIKFLIHWMPIPKVPE